MIPFILFGVTNFLCFTISYFKNEDIKETFQRFIGTNAIAMILAGTMIYLGWW